MPDQGGGGLGWKENIPRKPVMAEPGRDLRWWLSQSSLRVLGALAGDW